MAITYVGVGAAASGNNPASLSPALPASLSAGDVMIAVSVTRSAMNVSWSAGWNEFHDEGSGAGSTSAAWRVYQAGDAAPTVTPGSSVAGSDMIAQVAAWRGVASSPDPIDVFGTPFVAGAAQQNIGAITGLTPAAARAVIVVLGGKADDWTSVATLSGDGLTWAEIAETVATVGNDVGLVWDYAIETAGPTTVTSKTFAVTGGTTARSTGVMFSMVPGGATVTGAAAVAGAGSVAATATRKAVASGALAGAGAVVATATRKAMAAGAVAGAGTIAASGVRSWSAAGAIAGSGSVAASGVRRAVGTAGVAGAGSVSASAVRSAVATAGISGTGAVNASAGARITASAALSGSGSLAASAYRRLAASGSVTGAGVVTAAGTRSAVATAGVSGAGTIAAAGGLRVVAAATISGTGAVSAVGGLRFTGSAAVAGTGLIAATGILRATGPPAGVGVVSAHVGHAEATGRPGRPPARRLPHQPAPHRGSPRRPYTGRIT